MVSLELNENIVNLFTKNRKCIINVDLDGILSGMILQKFLNWQVVGYSCCNGKPDDELWLINSQENLEECVFVDLPVYIEGYSTIDQHFVAFEKDSINKYNEDNNKINPNIMREKVFRDEKGNYQYTSKYPFGTVHFILAILENLNIIDNEYIMNFDKQLENFDVADLILRADRAIGNTYSYTPNCIEWANWLIKLGGKNTNILFEKVKSEYTLRKNNELFVEMKLKRLGCIRSDGDCSNMFRRKNYDLLTKYFKFLADSTELEPLPVFNVSDFGKLYGKRFEVNNHQFDILKKESLKSNVFSFAFVNMRTLSLTYIEEEEWII